MGRRGGRAGQLARPADQLPGQPQPCPPPSWPPGARAAAAPPAPAAAPAPAPGPAAVGSAPGEAAAWPGHRLPGTLRTDPGPACTPALGSLASATQHANTHKRSGRWHQMAAEPAPQLLGAAPPTQRCRCHCHTALPPSTAAATPHSTAARRGRGRGRPPPHLRGLLAQLQPPARHVRQVGGPELQAVKDVGGVDDGGAALIALVLQEAHEVGAAWGRGRGG
jgi:hypothetical protein